MAPNRGGMFPGPRHIGQEDSSEEVVFSGMSSWTRVMNNRVMILAGGDASKK